jgi:cell division protein FtsI (penicillin-binding protein 3)
MSDPGFEWRHTLKRRILVVASLLGLWVGVVEARLVDLQIFRHTDLIARAERQQSGTRTTPGKRGDILDRRGHLLATSVDVDSIYAVPSEIDDDAAAVAKLCGALRDCSARDRDALTDRLQHQRAFTYVRRQVSPDEARRVAALNMEGVGFIKESRRFYPNKELAAHLLGYVGVDGNGLEGLESTYDSQIRGKPGTILIHTDAKRHAFSRFERPPTTGATVELTIDEYLQHIAEQELRRGIEENRAKGGSAIILNPHTGEILAMANEPTFNPNAYRQSEEVERRNRAVQDIYEPGSTFKVVTASAAIEERVMPIDTLIDTNPGQIKIGSDIVHDTKNHGVLSFEDVIVESSNVGAIKIGFKLGTERLSRYVSLFGFGHAESRDFPGESAGIVWSPDKWTERALASVSMGYQVGVTPLQMATAVGAIANGGELIEPRAVRAIYEDNRRYAVEPHMVRRAVSAETASVMTGIMEGVVARGTATAARITGYAIAGKTGTAHKLVNGRYSHSDYNASFVGFIPSRNPAVVIIVVIDSPHGPNGYFGGSVSAPVFRRIAETTLRYMGIAPTVDAQPPVIVARRDDAADVRNAQSDEQPVMSLLIDGTPDAIPDLRGLSARDAMRKLVKLGLTATLSGDGSVVSQNPPPGSPIEAGAVTRLVLNRWAAAPARPPQVQP